MDILADLKYAERRLRQRPGLLVTALLTPALGIEASKPAFDFPIDTHFGMDWRVTIFAVSLSLASAAVFGLLPGLRASRVDLTPALKSGTGTGASRHRTLRDVFVGVQIALCMVLVAGALMMVRTLKSTLAKNFGFNPAGAVALRFDLGMQGYSKERGMDFQRRLLDRVRAMPGVQAAGLADRLPLPSTARTTASTSKAPRWCLRLACPSRPRITPHLIFSAASGPGLSPAAISTPRTRRALQRSPS
jgi:hypothetical protein